MFLLLQIKKKKIFNLRAFFDSEKNYLEYKKKFQSYSTKYKYM